MAITTVRHPIIGINNAWTDIRIEDPGVTYEGLEDHSGPFLDYNYSYILETRDDDTMTSTFKFVSNIGYGGVEIPGGSLSHRIKYYNQAYTLNLGTVSNSGNISGDIITPWLNLDITRVDIPDSSVFTMTHRDAATVQYTLRYTANADIEYYYWSDIEWRAVNKYSVVATRSGTITSEAFIKKLYGSVNNQSERIIKLYGNVNGQSKRIKKLYGGVDGFSKRIF